MKDLTLDQLTEIVTEYRKEIICILHEHAVREWSKAALNRQAADGEVAIAKAKMLTLQTCLENERARQARIAKQIQEAEQDQKEVAEVSV